MWVGCQFHAPGHFTPRKDPVPTVQEAGWAPGPVWTGAENLAPTGIRSPDRPARGESLYRLSYPGRQWWGDLKETEHSVKLGVDRRTAWSCFTPVCFSAIYHFTTLLNSHQPVFGLKLFSWFISIFLWDYHFFIYVFFNLRPPFLKYN